MFPNQSSELLDYDRSLELNLDGYRNSDECHGYEDQIMPPADESLRLNQQQSIVNDLHEQLKQVQEQLSQKIDQNRDLRNKLEEYQEKYSKLFQEKTNIHEQYLQEKQNYIDLKSNYNDLQNQKDEDVRKNASFVSTEALGIQSQSIADLKYQLKLKDEVLTSF